MFILISYDIADDKRRDRVARLMEGFGKRVQYSVFECILGYKHLAELRKQLAPLINREEDSVRFYFLSKNEVARIRVLGYGVVTQDERLYLV